MRRKTQLTLIIGLTLVSAVFVSVGLWAKRQQSRGTPLAWDGPFLCVSQHDYFMAQMGSLLQYWKPQSVDGRQQSPNEDTPLLAVDLDSGVMWLDPQDQTRHTNRVALPAPLSWTLYCRDGDGVKTLPPFVCLKHSRSWHSVVTLVGHSTDHRHLTCILKGPKQGTITWQEGPFDPNSLYVSQKEDALSSFMVTDELPWDYGIGVATVNTTKAQGAAGFLGVKSPIALETVTMAMESEIGRPLSKRPSIGPSSCILQSYLRPPVSMRPIECLPPELQLMSKKNVLMNPLAHFLVFYCIT